MTPRNAFTYQAAAAAGATQLGLTILVYDAIARDLFRSGKSLENKDIEQRCTHSKHALLLLAHLESWVELLDDPALSDGLRSFYSYLRTRITVLQSAADPSGFYELAALVSEVRATWQTKEQRSYVEARPKAYEKDSDPAFNRSLPREPLSFRA